MAHSRWIGGKDLLLERQELRRELARLRTENERLRGALVEQVLSEVHSSSKNGSANSGASSGGC